MNCEHARNFILLEQSHELGLFGQFRLAHHTHACQACATYARESRVLQSTLRGYTPDHRPGSYVLARIEDAAARISPVQPAQAPARRSAWIYAAATAALVVAIGLPLLKHTAPLPQPAAQTAVPAAKEDAWGDTALDAELSKLQTTLASISQDENNGQSEKTAENIDLNAMARDLLSLEGLTI